MRTAGRIGVLFDVNLIHFHVTHSTDSGWSLFVHNYTLYNALILSSPCFAIAEKIIQIFIIYSPDRDCGQTAASSESISFEQKKPSDLEPMFH